MKKKTDIIVQARMGATRLPGKVLLPFGGSTVLEFLLARLKKSTEADRIIVATTDNPLDDALLMLCQEKGHEVVRGSEPDVLDRFTKAAAMYGSDIVVRVTADNPFIDVEAMDALIRLREEEDLDYVGNHQRSMPSGLGSEVMTTEALLRASREARAEDEREHVTPYFYRNPTLFKQKQLDGVGLPSHAREKYRLTLDTEEDYAMLQVLMKLCDGDPQEIQTSDILMILEEHPDIALINQAVEQKKVVA